MQQKQIDAQKEMEERRMQHEKELKLMDRETQLAKAEIDVYKFQQNLDANNDGIPDPLQIEQLRSKEKIEREKMQLEREKLASQERIKEKEIKVKSQKPKTSSN